MFFFRFSSDFGPFVVLGVLLHWVFRCNRSFVVGCFAIERFIIGRFDPIPYFQGV